MSFQYIHTSAKRGLEPGKSGFCCVARDRSTPPDLVAELESQSRYTADSHGAPPLILRHRVVTLRSDTYHILSRIQESGTDYSKRNNHIAHHIAFAQGDIPGLPNPAAILLNWRGWRDKWDEPPRILEHTEAFDLQDIESFWATQRLPETFPKVSQNGNLFNRVFKLSIQEERLLIEHLRRSLNDLPTSQRWRHTFTSCLLPTDQPHDYSWAGYLPSLSLPYDLPIYNKPLQPAAAVPATTPRTQNPDPPPAAPDSPSTPPGTQSPEPKTQRKKFAAPVVEIPEEYDHRKRKRPKRPFGHREFSRTINISIAGIAVICIALILFFVQTHRSGKLTYPDAPNVGDAARALQARQDVWNRFADAGYPKAKLEDARATAQFLAKAGEDSPQQIIEFLDGILSSTPEQQNDGIAVPTSLIHHEESTFSLPLSTVSYPTLSRLALLPSEAAPLLDFPNLEQKLAPLSAMPSTSFSFEALSNSLEAYLLLADSDYDALPQTSREAIDSYYAQLEAIRENHQFAPVLDLPQNLGLPPEAAYIATDSRGLLIPGTPMSLTQYLRELFASLIKKSPDQAFQSSAFQTAIADINANTRATPAEIANQINNALAALNLGSRNSQDPLRKLRSQWQYTFTHPDLMEQTIIGYNLDALESAKLRLAETRSQFSQPEIDLHLASQDRAAKATALIEAAKESAFKKEWIVINKQSTKFPHSLP